MNCPYKGRVTIIGGGLAGSEAAWQVARQGIAVDLYEMRPHVETGVHEGGDLAQIVCSNSLGSHLPHKATGLLQAELNILGSFLLECARATSVPAGGSLAVDRQEFPRLVTKRLEEDPLINIIREEVKKIPDGPCIIASGPLTSPTFSEELKKFTSSDHLFFFDALAPIVSFESIDQSKVFRQSRREEVEGDYLNCPMNREEYEAFIAALLSAEKASLKSFEEAMKEGVKAGAHHFFEGCLPVEVIASRGKESLAFGPMRPVGLKDPRTGLRPHAVVQLRQDNQAATLYNLVGFQTNLKIGEQERVFRMIPGLENAEIVRHGQMHRNTFVFSPALLHATLQCKQRPDLFFAGQITGMEGYAGNIASGLLAGINLARHLTERPLLELPPTTMLGALCRYITHAAPQDFQPMKANFGLFPPLGQRLSKPLRGQAYADRALEDLKKYVN